MALPVGSAGAGGREITAVDAATDMSTAGFAGTGGANLFRCAWSKSLGIFAAAAAASATLTGTIVLYDSNLAPIGILPSLQFTASASLRDAAAGAYLAPPDCIDTLGAEYCQFLVTGVGGTTWSLILKSL